LHRDTATTSEVGYRRHYQCSLAEEHVAAITGLVCYNDMTLTIVFFMYLLRNTNALLWLGTDIENKISCASPRTNRKTAADQRRSTSSRHFSAARRFHSATRRTAESMRTWRGTVVPQSAAVAVHRHSYIGTRAAQVVGYHHGNALVTGTVELVRCCKI